MAKFGPSYLQWFAGCGACGSKIAGIALELIWVDQE